MEPSCCWHKEQIGPEECPFIRDANADLLLNRKNRVLQYCLECPRFMEDVRRLRKDPDSLAEILPYLMEDLQELRIRNRLLNGQVEVRNREIKFLHEVSLVLQTSMDVDEVIAMALTAVTAGEGFGLNRAILLLVDKERQNLKGHFAVGPRRREDAARIWKELEEKNHSLRELAQTFFEMKMSAEKARFQDLLEKLSVPLSRSNHLFVRTLNEQKSSHVQDLYMEPDIDPGQVEALEVHEMILVPLISRNRRIGLLMADNIINGQPITTDDLHSLETFALPVSFAIERAALYERLQEELTKLTDANRRLKEQQEIILRMEKMALVGKITSNIAHSIRNPLTIIGGFARTLIKNTPPDDSKRHYIESIIGEAKRLEEVLQEVLNYSESLHPTFDLWDVNQLITGVYVALQDDFERNGMECRLDLDSTLPPVRLDYKKMTYCLRSIINNSLEAMPRGGTLEIRTLRSDDELLILLSDSGPGMGPETIKGITSPFFSTKDIGSGLGLSLCARILEGHGAGFTIRSTEGRGSTFQISLKLSMEEEQHGPLAGSGR